MTTPTPQIPSSRLSSSLQPNNLSSTPPQGLGSQPTTLSSAKSSVASSGVLATVLSYYETFSDFLRRLIADAVAGIYQGLSKIIHFFRGTPEALALTSSQWQLPPETRLDVQPLPQDLFSQLQITDTDRQKIFAIVHPMSGGWLTLLRQKSNMERLGNEIQHVHPLKFLEYTFKHPQLIQDLNSANRSPLIWNPFVQGVSEKLRREASTLPACKQGFAQSLNLNLNDLDPLFASQNWASLIQFLLDVKVGRRASTWVESSFPSPTPAGIIPPPAQPAPVSPIVSPTIANLPFPEVTQTIFTDLLFKYVETNPLALWAISSNLNRKWAQLNEVHPIKLLAFLHSHAISRGYLRSILKATLKKSIFLDKFAIYLNRKPWNEIQPYVEEFAGQCQLASPLVTTRIQNREWNTLIQEIFRNDLT
jgi:hypothetical protein